MLALFQFLFSGAKFVATKEEGVHPIFGTVSYHEEIGQWYPLGSDSFQRVSSLMFCLGCGLKANSYDIEIKGDKRTCGN